MIILTMFAVLLLLLSINVPIAIGLAVTTIIAMVLKTGTSFLIDTAIVMFDGSMKFPLMSSSMKKYLRLGKSPVARAGGASVWQFIWQLNHSAIHLAIESFGNSFGHSFGNSFGNSCCNW